MRITDFAAATVLGVIVLGLGVVLGYRMEGARHQDSALERAQTTVQLTLRTLGQGRVSLARCEEDLLRYDATIDSILIWLAPVYRAPARPVEVQEDGG